VNRTRRAAALLAWLGLLAAALIALALAGHGQLATPPLTAGYGAVRRWAEARDAPTILVTGLRLLAMALACYLVAVTLLGAVARATRVAAAVRWTDAVTVPGVRRLLGGATGLLLTAAPIALTMPHSPPAATSTAPRLTRLPPGDDVAPRLSILPPVQAAPQPGDAPLLTPLPGPPPATWTVEPGDSFWRIAARTLAATWDRPVTDGEIDPYWRAVIAANRAKLADQANPDLLYPAQVMTLPAPPPAP
jgi:hypothetical protein